MLPYPSGEVTRRQALTEVIRHSGLFPRDDETSIKDLISHFYNNQEKVLLVIDGYDEYRTGSEAETQCGFPIYEIFHGNNLRGYTVLVTTRSSRAEELQGYADKHAEITAFGRKGKIVLMREMLNSKTT